MDLMRSRSLATVFQAVLTASTLAVLHSESALAETQPAKPVERFDIVIGAMCIGDIPRDARVVDRTIQQGNDSYEDWTLVWRLPAPARTVAGARPGATTAKKEQVPGNLPGTLKSVGNSQPKSGAGTNSAAKGKSGTTVASRASDDKIQPIIRFFRRQLPNSPGTSCRELKGDILLSGDVDQIRLSARTSVPGNRAPAQIEVFPEGLSVTVGHVRSGLATLFGGEIDLSGSKAWIEQYDKLTAVENQPPQGAIEITSWARRIKGANFVLEPGAPKIALDMSSSRENVTIKVPLDGKYTELIDGGFNGEPPAVALASFDLPTTKFSNASVDIGTLTVERFRRQQTNLTLSRTSVRYDKAIVSTPNSSLALDAAGAASIDKIAALLPPAADVITLQAPTFQGLLAKGSSCEGQITNAELAKSATCTARATQPSAANTRLEVVTEALKSVGFDPMLSPVSTTALSYKIDQQGDRETFSGRMAPVAAKFGALQLQTLQEVAFRPSSLNAATVKIPISIDLPSSSGELTLNQGANQIVLSGKVDQVKLDAILTIDGDSGDPWSVSVEPGNFAFAASALLTVTPLVYGGKTELAGVGIRFVNLTQLSISRSRKSGQVLFTPSLLTVLDPKLELAKTKEGITIRAPAKFDASPTLAINLENGGVSVRSGHFLIEEASAATGPNGFADLGDVRVKTADVGFRRLEANYANGAGTLQINEFKASAEEVASIPPSKGGDFADQIQWSGRPTDPIKIGSFEATLSGGDNTGAMRIDSYIIKDFCVSIGDAHYGDPVGFAVDARLIKFCAAILATNAIRADLEVSDGKGRGSVDSVSGNLTIQKLALHLTAGTPAKPTGSGQLLLGPMDLSINTPVEIKQSCFDVPDFQKVPARTKFSSAATVAAVTITDGQLSGGATALLPKALLESTGQYDCRGALVDWLLVKEQRVVYDYPCPTWSKPFRMCRGWTILVPELRVTIDSRLRIYKLLVSYLAPASELRIRSDGGKAKVLVCLGAVNMTNPLIAPSFTVQPRTPFPGFDRFMGDVLGIVVAPLQAALTTSLGNFGALVLNFLDATGIHDNCLK
jgi:hypothetical protein